MSLKLHELLKGVITELDNVRLANYPIIRTIQYKLSNSHERGQQRE